MQREEVRGGALPGGSNNDDGTDGERRRLLGTIEGAPVPAAAAARYYTSQPILPYLEHQTFQSETAMDYTNCDTIVICGKNDILNDLFGSLPLEIKEDQSIPHQRLGVLVLFLAWNWEFGIPISSNRDEAESVKIYVLSWIKSRRSLTHDEISFQLHEIFEMLNDAGIQSVTLIRQDYHGNRLQIEELVDRLIKTDAHVQINLVFSNVFTVKSKPVHDSLEESLKLQFSKFGSSVNCRLKKRGDDDDMEVETIMVFQRGIRE